MPKPTLPKRDQAILSAHEAGMHDRVARPETCRECAQTDVAVMAPVVTANAKPVIKGRLREVRRLPDDGVSGIPLKPRPKTGMRGKNAITAAPLRVPSVEDIVAGTPSHPVCRECGEPVYTPADVALHATFHQSGTDTILDPLVNLPEPLANVPPHDPLFLKASTSVVDVPAGLTDEAARLFIEHATTDLHTGDVYAAGCPTCDPPESWTFETREAWMLAAVEAMRPWMDEVSAPVGPLRISFGWPGGRGSKKNVRGQCWMPEAVKDQVPAVFVSPAMEREDVPTILGIILHEMNHAAGHFGHTGAFAKTAAALGFLKPWTSSEGKNDDLKARLTALAERLGPLDHGSINAGNGLKGNGPSAPPVQSTRMLKVWCEADGYTLRTTAKWLAVAVPTCPLCETTMEVERK